jgi:hypothetical protein
MSALRLLTGYASAPCADPKNSRILILVLPMDINDKQQADDKVVFIPAEEIRAIKRILDKMM